MTNPNNPLTQLRDLHYPQEVSQLPIALGWWLVAFALLACVLFVAYRLYLSVAKSRYRRTAIKQLQQIFSEYEKHKNDLQLLSALNSLLKSVALQQYPKRLCSALSGEQWQRFLISTLAPGHKIVASAFLPLASIYQAQCELSEQDRQELKVAITFWIKKHREYAKLSSQAVTVNKGEASV